MSKARAHAQAAQEFQFGEDTRLKSFIRNLQTPDQRTALQDLALLSPQIVEAGWQIAAENKQNQINAINAKQLGLDLNQEDSSRFLTKEDVELHNAIAENEKIEFDSVEKSARVFVSGIPRDYAVLGKNLSVTERQILQKQNYNTALTGLQANLKQWTTPQFTETGERIPGLKIRTADGRILDATDPNLSRADFAEVEEFITAKYLQPVLGGNQAFQRKHLHPGLTELKQKVLADYVNNKNQLAEFKDRQTYKNFLTQNAGSLTAEQLGGMLSLSKLFTNDKGKPLSNTERHEYLTQFIKDLAITSPATAGKILDDMEENGYMVGSVKKKFGAQRIDSLRDAIAKASEERENKDYLLFKRSRNDLGTEFREKYYAETDPEKKEQLKKDYQAKYEKLGPWATGKAGFITKVESNEKADKESQRAQYIAQGYITDAQWDTIHPELRQELQGLREAGGRLGDARKSHFWTKREASIVGLIGSVEGVQVQDGALTQHVAQQTFMYALPDFEQHFEDAITKLKLPVGDAYSYAYNKVKENIGNPADIDALKRNPYYKQSLAGKKMGTKTRIIRIQEESTQLIKDMQALTEDSEPWVNDKGEYSGPDVSFLDRSTYEERKDIIGYIQHGTSSHLVDVLYKQYLNSSNPANQMSKYLFARRLASAVFKRSDDDKEIPDAVKFWSEILRKKENKRYGPAINRAVNRASAYPGKARLVALRSEVGLTNSNDTNLLFKEVKFSA